MDIKKPQLVKVEAFAVIFLMRFCNTLSAVKEKAFRRHVS